MPQFTERSVSAESLLLDPNNYRFQDDPDFVSADSKRFHETSVQDRAYQRIKPDGIAELKNSIIKNGFLPVERIVVRNYSEEPQRYLVLEGNRRVAALKWIKEDHAAGVDIPTDVVDVTAAVPVLIVDDEAGPAFFESLMGIRHVSGIKQWGGYQRAKLVATLKDAHGLDSGEVAGRLAMSTQEVNRRYRAYKALEQMQNDESFGAEAKPDMYPVFHEAVSLPDVRRWIGWNEGSGRFLEGEMLQEFYGLIAGPEDEDGARSEAKLPTYQEVRALKDIVSNEEAKRVLLDTDRTFIEAVTIARRADMSRSWKSEVAAAISALQSIGIAEFRHLNADDVAEIQKVRDVAEELLENYRRLNP